MSDLMTDDLYNKCAKAEAWVTDPLFNEMFDAVEGEYIKAWKDCNDENAREALWHQVQALNDVQKGFLVLAQKKEVQDLKVEAQEKKDAATKLARSKQ